MKYNITSNDGERTSVTAFGSNGKMLVATREHPRFSAICNALTADPQQSEDVIVGMFDITVPLARKFHQLSERVAINNGQVYFDGDRVDDEIAHTIVRYYFESNDDFMPLVNFMEKIATNPNEHSREHLFRWLRLGSFCLTADGDFIAYKGIRDDDFSNTSGQAFVNGEVIKGNIPNRMDTVIEMPRSEVTFDPRTACSTGLHAGNWRYARGFGSKVVMVKINPRDVVSVPVDSSNEKLRVCRYRVLGSVTSEQTKLFFDLRREPTRRVGFDVETDTTPKVAPAPAKAAAAKRRAARKSDEPKKPARRPHKQVAKPVEDVWPEFYEQFKASDFERLGIAELRWLAGEWGVEVKPGRSKNEFVLPLLREAKKRLRTWK